MYFYKNVLLRWQKTILQNYAQKKFQHLNQDCEMLYVRIIKLNYWELFCTLDLNPDWLSNSHYSLRLIFILFGLIFIHFLIEWFLVFGWKSTRFISFEFWVLFFIGENTVFNFLHEYTKQNLRFKERNICKT